MTALLYRWHSYLTPCSKTCGKGTQRKSIECRRLTVNHYRVVHDSECTDVRPTAAKPHFVYCNEIACPPIYLPGTWSAVSTINRNRKTRHEKPHNVSEINPFSKSINL